MTTKGEYRVGIDFNPSGDDLVARIKRAAADLIDLIEGIDATDHGEKARLKALAQTEIESAAMWAVKAATKKPMVGAFATPAPERRPDDDLFDTIVADAIAAAPATARGAARIDAAREALNRQGFLSVSDRDIAAAIARKEMG